MTRPRRGQLFSAAGRAPRKSWALIGRPDSTRCPALTVLGSLWPRGVGCRCQLRRSWPDHSSRSGRDRPSGKAGRPLIGESEATARFIGEMRPGIVTLAGGLRSRPLGASSLWRRGSARFVGEGRAFRRARPTDEAAAIAESGRRENAPDSIAPVVRFYERRVHHRKREPVSRAQRDHGGVPWSESPSERRPRQKGQLAVSRRRANSARRIGFPRHFASFPWGERFSAASPHGATNQRASSFSNGLECRRRHSTDEIRKSAKA